MRLTLLSMPVLLAFAAAGCAQSAAPIAVRSAQIVKQAPAVGTIGFDRNEYPGDSALPILRRHFAFAGYWLNNPPGSSNNTWQGKREALLRNGFGFLVLFNGRLDTEIAKAGKSLGTTPEMLAAKDASDAVAAARRDQFSAGTIIFLDQEEGGRLTVGQAAYLFAWTEAIARSGYRPGVYTSGQPVGDGPGKTITTADDIRQHVAVEHLHAIALWVYQDACPPAKGCVLTPPALSSSGTAGAMVWQYAQSPRRRENTAACSTTYAADRNCYAPELPQLMLDLNVANSPDPSHGR